MRLLERLAQDVRYAARSLRRSPGFALATIAVLAIGIGANTAIFSVAKDLLFRPLPYPEPDRLVQYISRTQTGKAALASVPKFNAWQSLRIHETITAYRSGGPGVTLTNGGRREHVVAMYVSSEFFGVFKASMTTGRAFRRSEDVPQGPRVVVVSHGLATRVFGGFENPVGRLIELADGSHEIVGVLGAGFRPLPHADIFLPLQAPHVSFDHTNDLTVVARLKRGIAPWKADRELSATTVPFQSIFPQTTGPYETFGAEPLEHMIAGDSRAALQLLASAVVFVLLIACANAANLFMARSTRRRGDVATRAALGAGRVRLVRLLFAECLLLSLAAGVLGLAAGYVGIRALLTAIPGALAGSVDVTTDTPIVIFTFAVSVLTAIGFGLLPALRASRVDLSSALKDNGPEVAGGAGQHRRQSLLVVAELTLAIVLLVGAGLLARTFVSMRTVDRGFRSSGLVTFEMPLTAREFQTAGAVDGLVREITMRLDMTAGVMGVAATYSLPLEPTVSLPFTLLDRPLHAAPYHGVGFWRTVSPGYFRVMGVPLLRGRVFTDRDDEAGQRVVIINRSMARRFWQDGDPIGRKIVIGRSADRELADLPRFVVGVVADVHDLGANRNPEPAVYVPIAQTGDRMMARNNRFSALTWLVRTDVDGGSFRVAVERELRDAAGGLPLARVQRIEDIVRAATTQLEFTTILLGVFAAAALVLAAVGLYGLMAYSVEQRRQEIGIRLALGADPASLRNMVLAQGGRLTAAGVCLGLAAAFLLARVMASVVVGMAAWDTTVFASVAVLLAFVSLAAAYVPAQDATRTDPLRALRRS
jgi:putative ABC transport system permease protein